MSTNILTNDLPAPKTALGSTWVQTLEMLWSALVEAKSASDRYEALIAQGLPAGEASQVVFREHFGPAAMRDR